MSLEKFAVAGFVLFIAGILLILISGLGGSSDAKAGGVLLLGPIPIIFGNDKRLIYVSFAFAAFVIVAWILARKWLK